MMETIKKSELLSFTPKQSDARAAVSKYKYVLYGGAMAGGKSYWLRWELIDLLLKWGKTFDSVEVGLFCEDYPALKDRHLSKIASEFPPWLGDFHADHKQHGKCFILKREYGGGIIKFRNLDDPSKYQSAEFAAIAVDELTKNEQDTFDDLRNRLRWKGIEDVRFIAATNPGGIGHAWVKRYWLDRDFPPEEQEAEQFRYIPARAQDNPHISSEYLKSLESLPPEKRRAYLEGDWDIFKGQYFSEWRREIHVCKPFTIPLEWKRLLWGDYGYNAPSGALWVAISPDKQVYLYRELYQPGLTYTALTDELIAMTPDDELKTLSYFVFDPAIWSKTGQNDAGLSGAEIMQARFREVMRERNKALSVDIKGYPTELILKRGNNDRINGWNTVREYLRPYMKDSEVTANLQVFDTCSHFIRTFPSLVYDEHKTEDLDSDGDDHLADALRYGLMDRPTPTQPRSDLEERYFKLRMKAKKAKAGKRNIPSFYA